MVNSQGDSAMVVRHLHEFSVFFGPMDVAVGGIVLHIYILICSNVTWIRETVVRDLQGACEAIAPLLYLNVRDLLKGLLHLVVWAFAADFL